MVSLSNHGWIRAPVAHGPAVRPSTNTGRTADVFRSSLAAQAWFRADDNPVAASGGLGASTVGKPASCLGLMVPGRKTVDRPLSETARSGTGGRAGCGWSGVAGAVAKLRYNRCSDSCHDKPDEQQRTRTPPPCLRSAVVVSFGEVLASESTYLNDISAGGVGFNAMVPLEPGTVLILQLPPAGRCSARRCGWCGVARWGCTTQSAPSF